MDKVECARLPGGIQFRVQTSDGDEVDIGGKTAVAEAYLEEQD